MAAVNAFRLFRLCTDAGACPQYIVIENVLSPEEVAVLNAKIDARPEMEGRGTNDWVGNARFGENPGAYQDMIKVKDGDGTVFSPGFLDWGPEFIELLTRPQLLPYLAFTMDDGWDNAGEEPMTITSASNGIRLDRLYGIEQTVGTLRQGGFHQGERSTAVCRPLVVLLLCLTVAATDWEGSYSFQRGEMRNNLVVVAYNLTDSGGELGGFTILPGSHKANIKMPRYFNDRLNGPENGTPMGAVCPVAPAGSVIMFSEASVHATHGFVKQGHKRRVLLYKYAQKHVAQGRDAVGPSSLPMTEEQAALFSSPQEGRAVTFRPKHDHSTYLRDVGRVWKKEE